MNRIHYHPPKVVVYEIRLNKSGKDPSFNQQRANGFKLNYLHVNEQKKVNILLRVYKIVSKLELICPMHS